LVGRHAMDRHSADTLAWRFVEIQTQKNQLKVGLMFGTRGRAFDWSPRDGPTLGRYASVLFIQIAGTKKPT